MREIDKLAKDVRLLFYVAIMFYIISVFLANQGFILGRDSTDGKYDRSGATLIKDYETGCEYLYRGNLIKRVDKNGEHICRKKR